ncbi:MAG: Ig-like domain-containing protein [Planctomycetota bacterium]
MRAMPSSSNNRLSSLAAHTGRNLFAIMLLLTVALSMSRTALASGLPRVPEFLLTDPGFSTGCKWQVWTNGLGYFQPSTSGDPIITGLGSPTYSGVLTAAPLLNGVIATQNWTVGSTTPPLNRSSPPYYLPHGTTTDNVCVQWDCYYKAPFDGTYVFQTASDDGSLLYIGQQQVVYNNRLQGTHTEPGPYFPGTFILDPIPLKAGYHKMTIMWGNGGGGFSMSASVKEPNVNGGTPAGNFAGIDGTMFVRRLPTLVLSPGINVPGGPNLYIGVNQTVTITATFPAATFPGGIAPLGTQIYYTTDGTIPTTLSTQYNGPFQVSIPRIISAVVIAPNFDQSNQGQVIYNQVPAPDPTFTPTGTTFTGTRTVTITSNVPNAFIYYTLDGSAPTLQNYTGVGASPLTLTVSATTVIKAFAIAYGYAVSATGQQTYTKIDGPPTIKSVLASGFNTQVNVLFDIAPNPNIAPPGVLIDQTSANTASNYTITYTDPITSIVSTITVISAALDNGGTGDFKTVRLTTSVMTPGRIYTLTVKNIKDTNVVPNIMPAPVTTLFVFSAPGSGLLYERWEGARGQDVASFTTPTGVNFPPDIFPDFPSQAPANPGPAGGAILSLFQEPSNTTITDYGSRVSGYFTAQNSGFHQFAITSDDQSVFYLSSDDNPRNKSFVTCKVTFPCNPLQWKYDSGSPTPENITGYVQLVKGKRYYIEMLHKQDQGNDHAAVAYVFPSATFVDNLTPPIPALFTSKVGSVTVTSPQLSPAIDALRIKAQPLSQSATADQTVTLAFDVTGSAPRTYQWSFGQLADGSDQVDIPGADFGIYVIQNLTLATAGYYRCRETNLVTTSPLYSNLAYIQLVDTVPLDLTNVTPALATLAGATNYPLPLYPLPSGPLNLLTSSNQTVINGTHFISGTSVAINGVVCQTVTTTNNQLTVIVPPSATKGKVDVAVTKPGGAPIILSKAFEYDDIPVAQAQTQTIFEDTAYTGSIVVTDPNDPILSMKIVVPPTKGTVVLGSTIVNSAAKPFTGTLSFTYTPFPNRNNSTATAGPDTFTFSGNSRVDGQLDSIPATVTINITPVNDPPTLSNPGTQNVVEDTPVVMTLTGLATGPATATDETGVNGTQTITSITAAVSAGNVNIVKSQDGLLTNTLTVVNNGNGTATLNFLPAFPGSFTISVTVVDSGSNLTNPPGSPNNVNTTVMSFNVNVSSVNDKPVIAPVVPQSGTSDVTGIITISGIAAARPNNPDEGGQNPLVTISAQALNATTLLSDPTYFTSLTFDQLFPFNGTPSGTVKLTYVPAYAKFGPIIIRVTVDDHQASNNTAFIDIQLNLTAVNHPPTAVDDFYNATQGKVMTVPAPGVLANDTDPDFNPLLKVALSPLPSQPSNGTLTLNSDGSFVYTPAANFNGTDSFTYYVTDGMLTSAQPATVTINVGANAAPIATDLAVSTNENVTLNSTLTATDPNFDTLTFIVLSQPTHGTLTLTNATTGAFTYVPNQFYNGSDSFTFKANDSIVDSNVAMVTITVIPVNQAPVATPQNIFVGLNRSIVITLSGTDVDGNSLTFFIPTPPTHGTLGAIVPLTPTSATVTYTPASNYVGSDTFQYVAFDGIVDSNPATVNIAVTPAPIFSTPPTINPNPAFIGADTTGIASAFVVNGTATIAWNFGDGSTGTGSPVTHKFTQGGVYTVIVTATSPEGVTSAPYSIIVQVGLGLTITPFVPGPYGFLVGDVGATAGCKSALVENFLAQDKSTFSGTVAGISIPPGLSQASLVNQVGILQIGQGLSAQQFIFTLDATGKAKATGLPTFQFALAKGTFTFKATGRKALGLAIKDIIDATAALPNGHKVLDIPVSLQIGSGVFLAMTFRLDYTQTASTGKGVLIVPKPTK